MEWLRGNLETKQLGELCDRQFEHKKGLCGGDIIRLAAIPSDNGEMDGSTWYAACKRCDKKYIVKGGE